MAARVPRPPATISVSTAPFARSKPRWARRASPLDVGTDPRLAATTATS
jgi:hypothetical protein